MAAAQAKELGREHEVTVFTPRYRGRRGPAALAGARVVALRPWGSIGNAAVLPQLIWRLRGYQVVHLHYPFFGAQEWLMLSLRPSQKLVITYHMMPQAKGAKGLVFRLLTRAVERRLAAHASLLYTQTHDFLSGVALPRLGQPTKWRVLPLGVNDIFSPGEAPASLRRELKLKEREAVLLFVGSLDAAHEFKGLPVLLKALAKLNDFHLRLLVVGKGNRRSQYERQSSDLGIAKLVTFVGFVPDEVLVQYIRLANMLVLPSVSQAETFGLVLLQAMAAGKPVIASRLPGVRELVGESRAGMLVTPGDDLALAAAIEHLLSSPAEANDMGRHGLEAVAEKYRWPIIGQSLRDDYRALV